MKLLDIKYNKKFPFIHISLQSLYIMLFEFMVTGVLAWIMESYIEYAFQGYFCDRGFFCGPFIPMYGVFILIICVINIFPKFNIKNLLIVSVLAFFVITLFEEAVGVICEKAFGSILWTYGGIPFTSNSGYTNLFISLGWGIGGALYSYAFY